MMASLRAYQEDLKKLVFIREPEATERPLTRIWGKTLPDRLKVYRNNTRTNWTDTLDTDFTLTRNQFEPEAWQSLAQRFFIKCPPQHWELNRSMAPFIAFLATQKIKAFIKELADFEWNDLKIFIDRSTVKKGTGTTNPTAGVRVYQHQIFDWIQAGARRKNSGAAAKTRGPGFLSGRQKYVPHPAKRIR